MTALHYCASSRTDATVPPTTSIIPLLPTLQNSPPPLPPAISSPLYTPLPQTLLDALHTSLLLFPGEHTYTIQILRSQPRRSHALFPHASDLTRKIWQEEILVVLSEEIVVDDKSEDPTSTDEGREGRKASVPIVALEANIYFIPSTSTSLLYISKVDTTGLSPPHTPSPARTLIASFLTYMLLHPPHQSTRLRTYIFSKSSGQYLYPGSVENVGKKVLDDKGLLRWWKGTLEIACAEAHSRSKGSHEVKKYYLVPGLSYHESIAYLPPTSSSQWTYSHPYLATPSPLYPPPSSSLPLTPSEIHERSLLTNHLACFPDDPKSRFLSSLSSSSIPPAGSEGDYDDLVLSLSSNVFTTGSGSVKAEEVERERERERRRLIEGVPGGVEEWWERMQFRQECCSGILVGFFCLVRDDSVDTPLEEAFSTSTEEQEQDLDTLSQPASSSTASSKKSSSLSVKPPPSSLLYKTFISLWSQFHNVDYALPALSKLVVASDKWSSDLERLIRSEGYGFGSGSVERVREGEEGEEEERQGGRIGKETRRNFKVFNEVLRVKRGLEEIEKKVNVMVPRKKKVKVV